MGWGEQTAIILVRLKDMKNYIRFLMLFFFVLSGCTAPALQSPTPTMPDEIASMTPSQTATRVPATAAPTETPISAGMTVLRFWHPWTGEKARYMEDMVAGYNTQNAENVMVVVTSVADENYLKEIVLENMQEDELPDILIAYSDSLLDFYEMGILRELDDLVSDTTLGIAEEEARTIPAAFWTQDVNEDIRYAIPFDYDLQFLFYNQTWAQELGFTEPPTTPEELLNQACAAARANAFDGDDENNGTGGWIYDTEAPVMLSWMQAFGGGQLPEEGRTFDLTTEENQAAFEYLRSMYQINCAWTGREDTPYRYFSGRFALLYSGSLSDWERQRMMDEIQDNTDEWTIIPYPDRSGNPIVNAVQSSIAIVPSDAERELLAWNFIRWMMQSEFQIGWAKDTYSTPSNLGTLQLLQDFMETDPAWQRAIQYLPLSRPLPKAGYWGVLGNLLEDAGWQLSLYNTTPADVLTILENMEAIVNEVIESNE